MLPISRASRGRVYKRYARTVRAVESVLPTDVRMMERALQLARAAAMRQEVPVGAIVYETASGKIISEASNTKESDCDPFGHAELVAMRAAGASIGDWRLSECTLVVTLEPCVMCAGAIVNARVGRVVYGADDPKAGAVRSLYRVLEDDRLNHRVRAVRGVMAQECGEVLRAFFKAKRRGS